MIKTGNNIVIDDNESIKPVRLDQALLLQLEDYWYQALLEVDPVHLRLRYSTPSAREGHCVNSIERGRGN
jgi:hypothetical protein